jgi:hypothetical protein
MGSLMSYCVFLLIWWLWIVLILILDGVCCEVMFIYASYVLDNGLWVRFKNFRFKKIKKQDLKKKLWRFYIWDGFDWCEKWCFYICENITSDVKGSI